MSRIVPPSPLPVKAANSKTLALPRSFPLKKYLQRHFFLDFLSFPISLSSFASYNPFLHAFSVVLRRPLVTEKYNRTREGGKQISH